MAEDFSADGMLDMYLYENGQLLEQLEATTLEKKDADSFGEADINEFFRVMHTIKGSSGIMMFDDIMKLAQAGRHLVRRQRFQLGKPECPLQFKSVPHAEPPCHFYKRDH